MYIINSEFLEISLLKRSTPLQDPVHWGAGEISQKSALWSFKIVIFEFWEIWECLPALHIRSTVVQMNFLKIQFDDHLR